MLEPTDFTQRYATGNAPWDPGIPSAELLRVLDAGKLPGKTVLEFGCGTGTNAIELTRRGYQVTAIDLVDQAIQTARDKARQAHVQVDFQVGDILQDHWTSAYDILFDRGVYHAVRRVNVGAFQQFLQHVSRPSTWWLSLAGNAKETRAEGGPPTVHEHEIRAELGSLFDIVELTEFRFATGVSDFHPLAWSILLRRR